MFLKPWHLLNPKPENLTSKKIMLPEVMSPVLTEINNEITDAVGELTNMISGQARQELEGIGKTYHGAIPSVVTGKSHKLESMTKGPKVAIPFKTDAGSFTIEVCLEKKSD